MDSFHLELFVTIHRTYMCFLVQVISYQVCFTSSTVYQFHIHWLSWIGTPVTSRVRYGEFAGSSPVDGLLQIQSQHYIQATWSQMGYYNGHNDRYNSFQWISPHLFYFPHSFSHNLLTEQSLPQTTQIRTPATSTLMLNTLEIPMVVLIGAPATILEELAAFKAKIRLWLVSMQKDIITVFQTQEQKGLEALMVFVSSLNFYNCSFLTNSMIWSGRRPSGKV